MSNKILNLDLSKDPIMPAIVYGRVGDDRLQTVTVNLTRRDEVADLTGYDITFEGTTYNRQTKVFDSNNISSTPEGLKKGTFDYTFPNMAFAVAGKYEQAYFSIVKDGKRDSTAGFEIYVDGNADIDAPEAETIITEYNILVTELNELQKQAITELNKQQNQAINEMNQNFTAAQERIAELEVQINDLRNKIDQALTDFENGNFWTKEESFNKEESSANVIDQIGGVESAILKKELLVDGTEGTGARDDNGTLVPFVESDYIDLNDPDKFVRSESLINGRGAEIEFEFPVISTLEKKYPYLFEGLKTMAEKKSKYLSMVKSVGLSQFSRGGGIRTNGADGKNHVKPYIKNLTNGFLTLSSWANTTNNFVHFNDTWNESRMSLIQNNGSYIVFVCSKKNDSSDGGAISDGITTAWVEVKDIRLVIELEANGRTVIESFIAAYHGENIATKEEALDGESNDKIMTPLRVADVISTLGSGGNAVASSEEALAGVENTKIMSALRVKEVLDARENEIATSNVFSAAFMRSGQISFMRRGPILIVNGTVTVKTAQAALTDLFVPDLGGKVPLNNAGNILAISDKAPYTKRFLISSNGGNFRTISALEADEYLAFSGSIMLAP